MQRKNKVFLRGVINSDIPMVSRFVTPLQGVSRFATVPWAVSQIGRVHSQTSALIWCSGIRKKVAKVAKVAHAENVAIVAIVANVAHEFLRMAEEKEGEELINRMVL